MAGNTTAKPMSLAEALRLAEERAIAGNAGQASDVYRQILASGLSLPAAFVQALRAAADAPGAASALQAIRDAQERFAEAHLAAVQAGLDEAQRALDGAAHAARYALDVAPWLVEAHSLSWAVERRRGPAPLSHAQFEQDLWLVRNVFGETRGGVFVDVGAYDGVTGSNTLLFERLLGWTGLCVEPDPDQFARLAANRSARCVQACIDDQEGSAEFLRVTDGFLMMGGLVGRYDPEMLEIVRRRSQTEVMQVATRRLDALLDEHGLHAIDYLSLDVEGAELAILRSLDFDRVTIRALSVENNGDDPELRAFLRGAGFRHAARLGVDDMFVAGRP